VAEGAGAGRRAGAGDGAGACIACVTEAATCGAGAADGEEDEAGARARTGGADKVPGPAAAERIWGFSGLATCCGTLMRVAYDGIPGRGAAECAASEARAGESNDDDDDDDDEAEAVPALGPAVVEGPDDKNPARGGGER
jgi:hypothetical protein